MSALLRLRIGVAAAGLSCLALTYAWSQQDQNSSQRESRQPSAAGQSDRSSSQQSDYSTTRRGESVGQSSQTQSYRGAHAGGQNQIVDHFLASCLLAGNEGEVQLSEIAQQKAENSQVKEFAQKMVQDHRKMIEQLQQVVGTQSGTSRGASRAYNTRSERGNSTSAADLNSREAAQSSTQTSDATTLPGSSGAGGTVAQSGTTAAAPGIGTSTNLTGVTTAADRMSGGGAVQQLMQIDRQIHERCTQSAQSELQQKSGAEFDKCYIGNAIGEHMKTLAALEVIGQQTQGQLAQIAKQAQPTVQQHLEMAKQIMKQLEGQSSATGSQAERRSSTRTE